jgi:hypothetical protein
MAENISVGPRIARLIGFWRQSVLPGDVELHDVVVSRWASRASDIHLVPLTVFGDLLSIV